MPKILEDYSDETNASCHTAPENMSLTNISVKFFPPNVTSLIQPLDQGIIRAVKQLNVTTGLKLFDS